MINGYEINGAEINGEIDDLVPVRSLHRSPWGERVQALHSAPWSSALARGFAAPWLDAQPVASLHRAPFLLMQRRLVSGGGSFRVGFSSNGSAEVRYALRRQLGGDTLIAAPLRSLVAGDIAIACGLLDGGILKGSLPVIYSLFDEAPLLATGTAYLLKDGQALQVSPSFEISLGEGEHYWQGSVSLKDPVDAGRFRFADPVTLHFYGTDFELVVDSVKVERGGSADTVARVALVSPSALLGKPPAAPLTKVWDQPATARSIVESLVGPVEWRIDDWVIPANRLGGDSAYPMAIAQRVAAAAGAVIEPYPDGSLYVRYQFEVPLSQYESADPDHRFSEAENVFSHADNNEYFEIRDQFRITDIESATFSDRIEWVADEDNGLAGQLHVYPGPWRPVTLRHTGPRAVALGGGAVALLDKEEQIEILDGKGSVQYPIHSIVGVAWEVVNLGGLSFEPGSNTVVSTLPRESLCTVRYRTRARVYSTSSPVEDEVQFVLYDGDDQ